MVLFQCVAENDKYTQILNDLEMVMTLYLIEPWFYFSVKQSMRDTPGSSMTWRRLDLNDGTMILA